MTRLVDYEGNETNIVLPTLKGIQQINDADLSRYTNAVDKAGSTKIGYVSKIGYNSSENELKNEVNKGTNEENFSSMSAIAEVFDGIKSNQKILQLSYGMVRENTLDNNSKIKNTFHRMNLLINSQQDLKNLQNWSLECQKALTKSDNIESKKMVQLFQCLDSCLTDKNIMNGLAENALPAQQLSNLAAKTR